MGRRLAAFSAALRAALAREELPVEPARARPAERRVRLGLRGLLAPEPLPPPPPAAPRAARAPGALRLLLAPEPLPRAPARPSAPRARWLAWLLAPEPLGPPPARPSDPPEVP
jgi:hypothetical protein